MKRKAKLRVVKRYRMRLPNRRVDGALLSDGTITWVFKRLMDGRVHVEGVCLSMYALGAMTKIVETMCEDAVCRRVIKAALRKGMDGE